MSILQDLNSSKKVVQSKFVKLSRIERFGYIINVYDALSYDIDIDFSMDDPETLQNFSSVCRSSYIYADNENSRKSGKAYRFRLFGIKAKKKEGKNNFIHNYVRNCLNRESNLLRVQIVAIDIYSRFLGNIYLHTIGNLSEYLIKTFPENFQIY